MLLEELHKKEYTLFIDVDGVFSDFNKWVEEHIGEEPSESTVFWDKVKNYAENNPEEKIWGALELMPDAMELWNYVKYKNPTFLSSTGTFQSSRADKEKREWLGKYFPGVPVITVQTSSLKAKYANENSILVDDRMKSIGPWRDNFGIGVLHKNAKETIRELKDLYGA